MTWTASTGRPARASVGLPIALRVFGQLAHCVGGGLRAAAEVELREDVRDVMLGRALADVEAFGDVRVRAPRRQQRKDLRLPLGEGAVVLGPCPTARTE